MLKKEGKSLEDANERYMAQQIMSTQINPDGSPKKTDVRNLKNHLLLSLVQKDKESNRLTQRPITRETVGSGSKGYMERSAIDLGLLRQAATNLHAIMMHEIEEAITCNHNSYYSQQLAKLDIVKQREEKAKPFSQGAYEDTMDKISILIASRKRLMNRSSMDTLDQLQLAAVNKEIAGLSIKATILANIPRPKTIPGYTLLYMDALRTVAQRKIGKQLGKTHEDNKRLTQIVIQIQKIDTPEKLQTFIQSKMLPDTWRAEAYTELLPYFEEVYANEELYSPTDAAILLMLANPSKPSMSQIRDRGIEGYRGRVIGYHKYALLYGSVRAARFWPQTL